MGWIAISFGIACAVVLVTAALFRSRDALLGAVVLSVQWGLTKVFSLPYTDTAGIMLDAFCAMLGALCGVLLMHRRRKLLSPWFMTASMLLTGLLVALWALARNMGFEPPTYPYAAACNLLYMIALLSVLSLGLHDGAVHIRAWLRDHPGYRPWSRPGARWGRDAPIGPGRER